MVYDFQDLVDSLADALNRPIALDDRDWRLLAASAYVGGDDAVRRHSLLARTASPEVAEWLRGLGIHHEAQLVETPENPVLEMRARTVAPIRHEGVLLGYLWVIADSLPLDRSEQEMLANAARTAAGLLWERRGRSAESKEREAELVAGLLESTDPAESDRAAAELRERPNWGLPSSSFALAVARLEDPVAAAEVGDRARRRWPSNDLLWRARGTELTALARLPVGKQPGELAATLGQAGARYAAALGANPLEVARHELRTVGDLLIVLEHRPELGPTAAASDLGAWPLVARLWCALGRPARMDILRPVLAHRSAAQLIEGMGAVLDSAGDVAQAADAIYVHRSTLYRRLETAEELTGLSLGRGDDRLLLQLALRMHSLAGGQEATD